MDRTTQYVEMCRTSNMQWYKITGDEKHFELGDWYYDDELKLFSIYPEDSSTRRVEQEIWLPTQSQIQEYMNHDNVIWNMCSIVDQWRKDAKYLSRIDQKSGEQIFLAAYMKWKFCKEWNGEKWVEERKQLSTQK